MKPSSFAATSEMHLSLWERSDRIIDAIRVRGYGLSYTAAAPHPIFLERCFAPLRENRPLPNGERCTASAGRPIEPKIIMC